MATLLESIQAELDAAINNDAALDAAAEAADITRESAKNDLMALRDAVGATSEALLLHAVQKHLAAVAETVIAAPEIPAVTEEAQPLVDVLIAQMAGDAEEIAEITADSAG
jgi:hypothetical protein